MLKLRIVRVDKSLPMPEYRTPGAAAFDLYSRMDAVIAPGEIKVLPSNFIIEVPAGYFLMVASRSSTPGKKGLSLPNGIGVIDQDYHGPEDEIGILVRNFTDKEVKVERGERIAQALVVPIAKPEFEEAEKIKDDSRGGFGSTG
jgi:dUTP pyrophosphatase